MTEPARMFCSRPFKDMDIVGFSQPRGDVYLCCSSWLPIVVGNVQRDSIEEIWNGPRAQDIRRSILDGSFEYCNRQRCPFLQTRTGPVKPAEQFQDPLLREAIDGQLTVLAHGPREINCSYDRSCNLSCPSCRGQKIIETYDEDEILGIQQKLEEGALRDAEYLYITGSGDAFGSPYFNRWLRTMDTAQMPNLRTIHLHTNAQLWTPSMWSRIPAQTRALIRSAEISIDAASAETYAVNRRGGSFERLLENLGFIAGLRQDGPLTYLKISMVVQENNFHEMPAFVRLGERSRADVVFFSRLVNWGTFSAQELAQRAVHRTDHPRHPEFLAVLKNPLLREPRVSLGNLTEFVV